ncbi:cyclic nucleotide-binding domain-containing protein [Candidatus Marinimicrobia bacterium]|nr:cyclic nucleotide-binding domain-containing protein [Candidatus Neomarinimicrobiota bacterium]
MKKNINTFKIFNGLSNDEIELFTDFIKIKEYKRNQTIINEGDDGDSLLFILKGEIIISQALTLATNKYDQTDTREKQLTNLNSDDHEIMLGEIALCSPDKKRNASVKAIKDCEIAEINFNKIFEICNENNSVGYKIMKNLSEIITNNLINSNNKVLKLTTAFSLLIDQ